MDSKKLMTIVITCGVLVLVSSSAFGQEWFSIQEDSELIGNTSYLEFFDCGPVDPVGTSLTIPFDITELSPWAYLYIEAVGVDPDGATYPNKIFFNNQDLGNLAGYEGFDCNEWDTLFMAMIGDLLVMGENEIRIESGYDAAGGEWDDFWVRHIRIYPDTVPVETTSWSHVKAVYR